MHTLDHKSHIVEALRRNDVLGSWELQYKAVHQQRPFPPACSHALAGNRLLQLWRGENLDEFVSPRRKQSPQRRVYLFTRVSVLLSFPHQSDSLRQTHMCAKYRTSVFVIKQHSVQQCRLVRVASLTFAHLNRLRCRVIIHGEITPTPEEKNNTNAVLRIQCIAQRRLNFSVNLRQKSLFPPTVPCDMINRRRTKILLVLHCACTLSTRRTNFDDQTHTSDRTKRSIDETIASFP